MHKFRHTNTHFCTQTVKEQRCKIQVRSSFIFPWRNKQLLNREAEDVLPRSYLPICSFGCFAVFVFLAPLLLSLSVLFVLSILLCTFKYYCLLCLCSEWKFLISVLFILLSKFISVCRCCDKTILCKSVGFNPNQPVFLCVCPPCRRRAVPARPASSSSSLLFLHIQRSVGGPQEEPHPRRVCGPPSWIFPGL